MIIINPFFFLLLFLHSSSHDIFITLLLLLSDIHATAFNGCCRTFLSAIACFFGGRGCWGRRCTRRGGRLVRVRNNGNLFRPLASWSSRYLFKNTRRGSLYSSKSTSSKAAKISAALMVERFDSLHMSRAHDVR